MRIKIEVHVAAPIEEVWKAWTSPADIQKWNAASDDWHCPNAEIDLSPGGKFSYRMEAKDGSMGFDLKGTITKIVPYELIEFALEDERQVAVEFVESNESVTVRESFDAESTNSCEQQRQGW
ncbi:SRPBCC domain-containing protein [Synechococcus sp. CS-1332]|uniref:SRPBCC domain-containing protein n=1 Tax=Synechococcus sp. CS-1332 TaxID=2847972 RepID=UPI00223A7E6F|nr:SRPBCC domain-containing protein [Synechococcus sp. CS-1332]MCT0208950.1 SRPBCC domain-containing protein [Synechococcus sp. CS-1332]